MNIYLRRYRSDDYKCGANGSYCNAKVFFCEAPAARDENGYYKEINKSVGPGDTDSRWPTVCEACGRGFDEKDHFQLFQDAIMREPATGKTWTFRDLPPGAVYNAYWDEIHVGTDGRSLVAICPDGHAWHIDARANNCTMKDDNIHRCWVRHGKPEDSTLHVDKNGVTCAAGAGSIDTGGYHGFLHNGEFS